MHTSDELREMHYERERRYDQTSKAAPLIAYEAYCPDFGETVADAELEQAMTHGHAAEQYVRMVEKRDSFRPQDVDDVTVKVRDVLGDRKWRTFVVESRLSVSYTAKEKT